jgi:hypothetical protein
MQFRYVRLGRERNRKKFVCTYNYTVGLDSFSDLAGDFEGTREKKAVPCWEKIRHKRIFRAMVDKSISGFDEIEALDTFHIFGTPVCQCTVIFSRRR